MAAENQALRGCPFCGTPSEQWGTSDSCHESLGAPGTQDISVPSVLGVREDASGHSPWVWAPRRPAAAGQEGTPFCPRGGAGEEGALPTPLNSHPAAKPKASMTSIGGPAPTEQHCTVSKYVDEGMNTQIIAANITSLWSIAKLCVSLLYLCYCVNGWMQTSGPTKGTPASRTRASSLLGPSFLRPLR